MRALLTQWNRIAVDLAKLDNYSVSSALASFHHKGTSKNTHKPRVSRAVSQAAHQVCSASFPLFAGRFASSACPTGAL